MPKFPKPWLRRGRGWYVTLDGQQIPLARDREAAFAAYHKLMQRPKHAPRVRGDSVAAVVDQFLDWCQKHRAPHTYAWYRDRLQLFVERRPELTVGDLRPFHVQEWIDSYDHLSSGSKRNHCRSIQRAMKWAEEQGLIDRSPIAHLKKPRAGRREVVITPEEYRRILDNVPNEPFRDLLDFAWETGARAAECMAIEPRHVDLPHNRIVFPRDEEKMRRAPRIIYLTETAAQIVRRRILARPERVFTNCDGRPWTPRAVNCAFSLIQIRMGRQVMKERGMRVSPHDINSLIPKLQPDCNVAGQSRPKTSAELKEEAKRKLIYRMACRLAPKYCLTAFRHSWCHHALRRGIDALTVSVLMGHADPSMVARVYSHLSHATDYLHDAAQRAVG